MSSARNVNLINVDIYTDTPRYKDNAVVRAKDAKEIFFLTADDLKYLHFSQPKGWGAYAMKTGACKHFKLKEVRALAIKKFGSVQALIAKAEALNKRRRTKATRDHQKQLDEEKRRQEAQAAAEQARLDAIAERKRKALEKKRNAEQQARDAESWRNFVQILGQQTEGVLDVGQVNISKILEDAASWRRLHHQGGNGPATKKQKVEPKDSDAFATRISP